MLRSKYRFASLFFVLLLRTYAPLPAQEPQDLPPDWQAALTEAQLEFTWPLTGSFREYRRLSSDFQDTDFALWSRRAKTEIRFLVAPYDRTDRGQLPLPHLAASRLVTHLTTNEEDAIISVHDLDPNWARGVLGADWAKMYYFPPKILFAPYRHCRLLALFREGVATAYVFYLFDDPPAELDHWLEVLRFASAPE